jgi:1,4-alpha-glucan branching enzyme
MGAKSRKVTKTNSTARYKKATKPRMTQEADEMFRAKNARHPGTSTTKKSVMFTLNALSGLDVSVAGSFNNWTPQAMTKGPYNLWRLTVQLAPGTYEYRFLVDTDWREDPNNPRKARNDDGGFNSICEVI